MGSSSSSLASGRSYTYDVFLNFRGKDTRKIFVGHLHKALTGRGLNTFIDSQDVGKGSDLSVLLKAIRESRISIIVFSQNYASSRWCLQELIQILECKAEQNQIVLPIFYQVDPSHVRKLKTSFAQAFAKHKHDSKTAAVIEEVQRWRFALTEAANLSGWDSRDYKDDAKLIDDIVNHIFKNWMHISSSKKNYLVGMDSHLHKMGHLLHLDVVKVGILGIWRMGGVGKSTIAEAVCGKFGFQFDNCFFLPDVEQGFGNKKVIVVPDNVDSEVQIETLLGHEYAFGCGSRIILTTRNSHLLNGFYERYEAELLSDDDAGKLFRQYALKDNKPSGEYDQFTRRALEYAQGLPLALKILGSHLVGKTVSMWEEELDKIKKFLNLGIQRVFRTSFDGLDDLQKELFLDIACFFKGMDYVTKVLGSCDGFYARTGLNVLVEKALVTISKFGGLQMHDLLQEISRGIVQSEKSWKHSRLWSFKDVQDVLTRNKANVSIGRPPV